MTLKLVHSRPATDPALLEFAILAGTMDDAVLREDMVQTLISTADLDRMVRSLGPHQREAANHARALIARSIEMLESLLDRSQTAARRDPRHAAYAAAAAIG